MAPVYPVTICRSDGLLDVMMPNGLKEPNAPSEKQQRNKVDENKSTDVHRRVADQDDKMIDWKQKLGGLLMTVLGGAEHSDRQYFLKDFPEGYTLWEHVKYGGNKSGDQGGKKNRHAAGGYKRNDGYLYGYPSASKKRFRSPAEFFPHLLWLASDPGGDQRNCTCRFCSPDGDDIIKPAPASEDAQPKDVKSSNKSAPKSTPAAPIPAVTAVPPPKAPIHTQSAHKSQVVTKSKEQEFDFSSEGQYIYRPGELIWFNNGANWRLGLVGKRGLSPINNTRRYSIQPLSNPRQLQQQKIKAEGDLRPWLAWSVPVTTVQSIQNLVFDQVPWDRVLSGELDQGRQTDYVVDGSILAAKTIDASYSLFDRDEGAIVPLDAVAYKGMFFGAEKIWVGEPVRLKLPGQDVAVYLISSMIEFPAKNTVIFKGDIYKLVRMQNTYAHKSQWPAPSKELPARMTSDLEFRNEVAARKGEFYDWQLVDTSAPRTLDDIKGRWYEMRALLPTLKGEGKYQADIDQGITSDAGEWMNSRRDNNPTPNQRKKNRKDTLGQSVPDVFKPSRGLDGPVADNVFPDEVSQSSQSGPAPTQPSVDVVNQYMNLDGPQDYYSNNLQR